MNHPFFVWYFQLYQFNTEIWLKVLSSVGRYPPAQDIARDQTSPIGR